MIQAEITKVGRHYWREIGAIALLIALISSVWSLEEPARASASPPAAPPAPPRPPGPCDTNASAPVAPTTIVIPGVADPAPVLALPRDRNNIPSPVPVTIAGMHEWAWDEPPAGVLAASPQGNLLLNAHTWPWPAGGALGNEMLTGLREGGIVILSNDTTKQCYKVTQQIEIGEHQDFPQYYDEAGPHQIAIMVCSGTRYAPGHWDHRMVWFATPYQGVV